MEGLFVPVETIPMFSGLLLNCLFDYKLKCLKGSLLLWLVAHLLSTQISFPPCRCVLLCGDRPVDNKIGYNDGCHKWIVFFLSLLTNLFSSWRWLNWWITLSHAKNKRNKGLWSAWVLKWLWLLDKLSVPSRKDDKCWSLIRCVGPPVSHKNMKNWCW